VRGLLPEHQSAAASGAAPDELAAAAAARGLPFRCAIVAEDAIVPLAHPANPLAALTLLQLRNVFSGRVANWRRLGGPDASIDVLVGPPSGGISGRWRKHVLGDDDTLTPRAQVLGAHGRLARLAAHPFAISYAPRAALAGRRVKVLRIDGLAVAAGAAAAPYPVPAPLMLVTLGAPSGAAARFIAYAASHGAGAVEAGDEWAARLRCAGGRRRRGGRGRLDAARGRRGTYAAVAADRRRQRHAAADDRAGPRVPARTRRRRRHRGRSRGIAARLYRGQPRRDRRGRHDARAVRCRGRRRAHLYLVARGHIGIVTHPRLPVHGLTPAQVRALLGGGIANWRAVGGPDRQVSVVAHARGTPARCAAEQLLLDGGDFAVEARECASDAALAAAVASDPGAIGYLDGRMGQGLPGVSVLPIDGVDATPATVLTGRYPYTHSFHLLLYGAAGGNGAAFVRFARSAAGQAIVARLGLLPVC